MRLPPQDHDQSFANIEGHRDRRCARGGFEAMDDATQIEREADVQQLKGAACHDS